MQRLRSRAPGACALALALAGALGAGCSSARPDEDERAQVFPTMLGYPGVVGHGTNDLWAYAPGGRADLQHWDGAQWTHVAVHVPGLEPDAYVTSATSAGRGAVWLALRASPLRVLRVFATGVVEDHTSELGSAQSYAPTIGGTEAAAIIQTENIASYVWSGERFVRVPAPPSSFAVISELTFGPADLWAASSGSDAALAHFDGVMWTRVGALPTGMTRWTATDSRHFWSAASDSRSAQSVRIVRYADGALSVVTALAPVGDVADYSSFRTVGAVALGDNRVAVVGLVGSQGDAGVRQDAIYFVYTPGEEISPRRSLRHDITTDAVVNPGTTFVLSVDLRAPLGDGTLVLTLTRGYVGTTYLAHPGDL